MSNSWMPSLWSLTYKTMHEDCLALLGCFERDAADHVRGTAGVIINSRFLASQNSRHRWSIPRRVSRLVKLSKCNLIYGRLNTNWPIRWPYLYDNVNLHKPKFSFWLAMRNQTAKPHSEQSNFHNNTTNLKLCLRLSSNTMQYQVRNIKQLQQLSEWWTSATRATFSPTETAERANAMSSKIRPYFVNSDASVPITTASIWTFRYCHQCNDTEEHCNSGAALTTTAATACAPASNLQFQASVPSLDFASLIRAAVYPSQCLYVFSKITNHKIPIPSLLGQPV